MSAAGNALRKLSQSLSKCVNSMEEVYIQFLIGVTNYCSKLLLDPGHKYSEPSSFALLSLASSDGKRTFNAFILCCD